MRVFTAVADAGSLSAAGRRLNMPLATVSRHLAALEEQIGVRLMTRTTRHLALTEPGRHYLQSCRRILAELEAADLALAGQHLEPRGEIAITAPAASTSCPSSSRFSRPSRTSPRGCSSSTASSI
jgi:DNA-binding transcriptional LysR family regulator